MPVERSTPTSRRAYGRRRGLYWGGIPATNTGTNGEHVPGHILIPPGTAWAPVPKTPKPVVRPNETPKPPKPVSPDNDAIIVFGSKRCQCWERVPCEWTSETEMNGTSSNYSPLFARKLT